MAYHTLGCQTSKFWQSFIVQEQQLLSYSQKIHTQFSVMSTIQNEVAAAAAAAAVVVVVVAVVV